MSLCLTVWGKKLDNILLSKYLNVAFVFFIILAKPDCTAARLCPSSSPKCSSPGHTTDPRPAVPDLGMHLPPTQESRPLTSEEVLAEKQRVAERIAREISEDSMSRYSWTKITHNRIPSISRLVTESSSSDLWLQPRNCPKSPVSNSSSTS